MNTLKTWIGILLLTIGACKSGGKEKSTNDPGADRAEQDKLTANVGKYSRPPAGAARPRVGVPPFKVHFANSYSRLPNAESVAADQATTLIFKTKRFRVIERAQLDQLLKEQNLEGIVKSGELARPAQVRGVDYLLIGRITNLQVRKETKKSGWSVGGIGSRKSTTIITVECGVDLRLVSPESGEALAMESSEYKRVTEASASGWQVASWRSDASSNVRVDEDNLGKILRLALDDAIRKMLPDLDVELVRLKAEAAAGN